MGKAYAAVHMLCRRGRLPFRWAGGVRLIPVRALSGYRGGRVPDWLWPTPKPAAPASAAAV